MLQVLTRFAVLPAPRAANARYELTEILFIAIAAMLVGAKTCVEMAEFGEAQEALLRQVLELRHGIPSHDTFSSLFRTVDPAAFETNFASFGAAFGAAIGGGDVIAVYGKAMRRAYGTGDAIGHGARG